MAIVTQWTLKSPDGSFWQPAIATTGQVSWTKVLVELTPSPPVYVDRDNPATVWTPNIADTGIVSYFDSAPDTGQDRAALEGGDGGLGGGGATPVTWPGWTGLGGWY